MSTIVDFGDKHGQHGATSICVSLPGPWRRLNEPRNLEACQKVIHKNEQRQKPKPWLSIRRFRFFVTRTIAARIVDPFALTKHPGQRPRLESIVSKKSIWGITPTSI